jgi:hypothetical protein
MNWRMAAGADPFIFRRALVLAASRHRRVFDLAAENAAWGQALARQARS